VIIGASPGNKYPSIIRPVSHPFCVSGSYKGQVSIVLEIATRKAFRVATSSTVLLFSYVVSCHPMFREPREKLSKQG